MPGRTGYECRLEYLFGPSTCAVSTERNEAAELGLGGLGKATSS